MPIQKDIYLRMNAIKNNINNINNINNNNSIIYSFGSSCKVRSSIQRYLKNDTQESGFFDWIFSNLSTVIYYITNIDIPIKIDDFYNTNEICSEHIIIKHNKIFFESLHDINKNNSYELEIIEFINKYNRRLFRLKNLILNNKKIDFIHLFFISDNNIFIPSIKDIEDFFIGIYKINPDCNFNLHLLVPPKDCNYTNSRFEISQDLNMLVINNKVHIHYLYQDDTMENKNSCNHWSWYKVYDIIYNKYMYYSQCEEDLFLNNTFFKNKTKGIYIELGALDGVLYSNTKFFED